MGILSYLVRRGSLSKKILEGKYQFDTSNVLMWLLVRKWSFFGCLFYSSLKIFGLMQFITSSTRVWQFHLRVNSENGLGEEYTAHILYLICSLTHIAIDGILLNKTLLKDLDALNKYLHITPPGNDNSQGRINLQIMIFCMLIDEISVSSYNLKEMALPQFTEVDETQIYSLVAPESKTAQFINWAFQTVNCAYLNIGIVIILPAYWYVKVSRRMNDIINDLMKRVNTYRVRALENENAAESPSEIVFRDLRKTLNEFSKVRILVTSVDSKLCPIFLLYFNIFLAGQMAQIYTVLAQWRNGTLLLGFGVDIIVNIIMHCACVFAYSLVAVEDTKIRKLLKVIMDKQSRCAAFVTRGNKIEIKALRKQIASIQKINVHIGPLSVRRSTLLDGLYIYMSNITTASLWP